MLLGSHTELVVEGVMPDLLHVIPVGNDTMLDGVLQSQNTSLALRLITDVGVLLVHTNHDARPMKTQWSYSFYEMYIHLRATNNGREYSSWGVITGESGLAHS